MKGKNWSPGTNSILETLSQFLSPAQFAENYLILKNRAQLKDGKKNYVFMSPVKWLGSFMS